VTVFATPFIPPAIAVGAVTAGKAGVAIAEPLEFIA
jgi:hypothetical protein